MDRLAFSSANCSIARTLEIVGERWTFHVLRELFFGLRRFEDLHRAVGCNRTLLSDRLTTLVDHGILAKVDYREPKQRSRPEYRLTDKGQELLPGLLALMDWGDRWTADPEGPAVTVRHNDCDAQVHVTLACDAGHRRLRHRDVRPTPGAGARPLSDSGALNHPAGA
jgi:DNA-binding HxlR family transcriptional regulator